MSKLLFIQTLGCAMNVRDSEHIIAQLKEQDYEITDDVNIADLILINTCSVREKPVHKLFSEIGAFDKARKKGSKIGVCGCTASHLGGEIFKRAPFVDFVLGARNVSKISQAVRTPKFISTDINYDESEFAFGDLNDNMDLAESMLKYIINYVLENAAPELEFFNQFVDKGLLDRLKNVVESDFGRITYTEAIEILEKNNENFEYKVSWGCDLQTEHERYLTEQVFKKPIFVTDYPKAIKAFYMKENEDKKTVAAMDCLVPGIGEIMGGSQREDDYNKLLARIEELGMDTKDYEFYLDLRKYGSTRHAGFGLGFERCVMYLTGMSNIRDVLPFPRTVGNCEL